MTSCDTWLVTFGTIAVFDEQFHRPGGPYGSVDVLIFAFWSPGFKYPQLRCANQAFPKAFPLFVTARRTGYQASQSYFIISSRRLCIRNDYDAPGFSARFAFPKIRKYVRVGAHVRAVSL